MARLTALPSIDIIRGFKGVLDFYLWKGLPCVRRWPRMTKAKQTQASKDAAAIFGQISSNYRLLAPLALEAYQIEARTQPRTARDLYISGAYGHLHQRTEPPPPPPPEWVMYDAYVCVRDKKPMGTGGGTFTSGAWRTRDINDEHADPLDLCTIAANQITLEAGTYRCTISAPAFNVRAHQTRLYNVTDAALLLPGTVGVDDNAGINLGRSIIIGRFTLAAQKVLEIQHWCETTRAGNGFGVNFTKTSEIYTVAEFWREG